MKYLVTILLLIISFYGNAQQTEIVDFKKLKAGIIVKPDVKEIAARLTYDFEMLQDADSIYLDARNVYHYEIPKKTFKGTHYYADDKIIFKSNFKKGEQHTINMAWFINPRKAMYFIDWDEKDGNKQVWTQGQGKYTSNWLPSIDNVNDKIEFDLSIIAPKDYTAIANGKLQKKAIVRDSLQLWEYDMKQPMSSYLVALAIGKYHKKTEISESGIPLEMYYYPEDEAKFEPTYRYTKRIFDFLEKEIDVAYPWQNYKQVPVKDFLYAGMENTGTTIFSDAFVVDSIGFVDKNYVNVNAHELVHQWFGNLVTAKSGTHHWLQEGFATYYALLAEKEIFGDDYFHWKLYQSALQLKELNNGEGEALLNPKASSLTFYQKGAWALHVLRTKVGDKAFRTSVKRYLETYQFKSAETNDFIKIVEEESGKDLSDFVKEWLESKKKPETFYDMNALRVIGDIPNNHIFHYLGGMYGEPFIVYSIELRHKETINDRKQMELDILVKDAISNKSRKLPNVLISILKQASDQPLEEQLKIYQTAFHSNNIKIRQAIAETLTKIPEELKTDYESLLNDDSYLTKEMALYNLWANFPKEQKKYLDITKDIQGFNDKSFRTLWLTLALITPNYAGRNTPKLYNELSGYTSSKYHFEIRRNAFIFLNELKSFTDKNLIDLVNATQHHNWRFAKFSRELLATLAKDIAYTPNFIRIKDKLSKKEKEYLEKVMAK